MLEFDRLKRDISTLPKLAQSLVFDFVDALKQRQALEAEPQPLDLTDFSFLWGCGAIAPNFKTAPLGSGSFDSSSGAVKMAQILVDTDILIDISNDDETAKHRLMQESQTSNLVVSTVTAMELTVGCRNKAELNALNQFLAQFQTLKLTSSISDRATELLQEYVLSHGLRIADALIAATVIEYQIALLSKNQRDFRFISTLNLLPYP